ncbi:outer membrane protein assembly factor BamA [Frigidibacter sp. ROC022]|uniref:outer membrane protein assembly factor BamA n=1 Tax=Frigidibacter sp. ROC022 TaxID=2971796 RepID=UPI00215A8BF8|nr:outer membrane protein assembly factor BamA [Frigidibacter sp. ROC022]MCR8723839.1 outer membrane protein assembly factor BamA [Frigidibacter sp. ROC022]
MTSISKGAAERRGHIRNLALRLCVVLALGLSIGAAAVPGAAQAQSYSFNAVKIEGNQRIEPATILSYAGIPRGTPISAGQMNDAYQRLVNSGLFEAVELSPQGGTLVIRVTEYPTINRINVEGNRRLKDDQVMEFIRSQPRKVYSPAVAEQDAAAIVDAYESLGRLAATVTPKIIRRSGNRVDLVFEVAEGKVVEVERLSFVGNRDYSDARLRRVLGTKQAGIFRQIIQKDTFVPERIAFDKQVLRDFYLSRGYIDFRTKSVTSEFSREKNAFFLTFHVEEGQSYKFGKITVVSEIPEADAKDFESQLKIRRGATYSPALVDNVISRIEALALKKGMSFVRVDPRVTRHDRDATLDIEFAIVRGERIFVERIDIEGNATTLDRVIRNQFRTVEGDPFNPREIREASERIRALGFFSSTDVQARQGTAPDQVVVDVNVEEQNTGSLSFGASFSQDSGAGVNISFSESNFLGRGQGLRFEVLTTSSSSSFNFNFTEPNLLGRDLVGGLGLSYRETENYNSNFSTRTGKFSPSLSFPISDNGRLSVRYTLGYAELFDVDNGDSDADGFNDGDIDQNGVIDPSETASGSSFILQQEEALGPAWTSSLGYGYTYDTRTGGLDPRGGILLRFGQDFSGLGGNSKFIKTSLQAAAERRVANEEVTLRATFEGGALYMLDGESRFTDRYLLTSQQMRGFEYAGIGPRDMAVSNQDALGGNYYFVARLEAEFPLGLPEEYGISGGAFFDVGSLWGLDNVNGGATGTDTVDDGFHVRSSVGLSVFWSTPIGPLRFNFSKALNKQDYDRVQSFDLSISTRF